jgi:hypothetical protein
LKSLKKLQNDRLDENHREKGQHGADGLQVIGNLAKIFYFGQGSRYVLRWRRGNGVFCIEGSAGSAICKNAIISSLKEREMAEIVNKRKLIAGDLQVIGQLLVEVLGGEISGDTRQAILELGDAREIPPPYGQLVEYTQRYELDNKALAHDLQEQLRVICVMLLEKQI